MAPKKQQPKVEESCLVDAVLFGSTMIPPHVPAAATAAPAPTPTTLTPAAASDAAAFTAAA